VAEHGPPMDLLDSLPRFAVALGIGLLIGLERGWHTREMKPGTRAAGIRTFTIPSLLGATAGALAHAITDVGFFLGATLVAFAAIIILSLGARVAPQAEIRRRPLLQLS